MVASLWINMKLKQDMATLSMPLFGVWQTEQFVPPIAENGKVRTKSMIPCQRVKKQIVSCRCLEIATVMLIYSSLKWCQLDVWNSLYKVSKRLRRNWTLTLLPLSLGLTVIADIRIRCKYRLQSLLLKYRWFILLFAAIASLIRSDIQLYFRTDGFVVCEEFEQTLRDAWKEDQIHAAEKEQKKREERIYGWWKLLIKAALAKERIHRKYAMKPQVCTEMFSISNHN